MSTHVVELIGSRKRQSRSRKLAAAAVDELVAVGALTAADRHVIDLAEIAALTFDGTPAMGCSPVDNPIGQVCTAKLLVVASPVYKGSYTGLLKAFLDELPRDALDGVVAVGIITAHSTAHSRATGRALTALLHQMGATIPAPHLLVLEQDDPAAAAAMWAGQHGPAFTHALHGRPRPPRSARSALPGLHPGRWSRVPAQDG